MRPPAAWVALAFFAAAKIAFGGRRYRFPA